MPIEKPQLNVISEEQFHEIDYLVMKQAFASQNALGRYYDEQIYSNELARLCKDGGFDSVETEVPVSVFHKDFRKTYFLDLLINRSVVYELKTVRAFDGNHRRQLLNYLMLCCLHHGKLLNFRSPRVSHEFVSTTLDSEKRGEYNFNMDEWRESDLGSSRLRGILEDLLADWGAFLESSLYMDAAVHFLGGAEKVTCPIDVHRGNMIVGRQAFNLLNENTAFIVTAIKHENDYRKHLKTLLGNTSIECVQWINLNNHDVDFITIFE